MGTWSIHVDQFRVILLGQPQKLVDGLLLLLNVVLLDPGARKQVFLTLVLLLPLLVLLNIISPALASYWMSSLR